MLLFCQLVIEAQRSLISVPLQSHTVKYIVSADAETCDVRGWKRKVGDYEDEGGS